MKLFVRSGSLYDSIWGFVFIKNMLVVSEHEFFNKKKKSSRGETQATFS